MSKNDKSGFLYLHSRYGHGLNDEFMVHVLGFEIRKNAGYVFFKDPAPQSMLVYFEDQVDFFVKETRQTIPPHSLIWWTRDMAPLQYGSLQRRWSHSWLKFSGSFTSWLCDIGWLPHQPMRLIQPGRLEQCWSAIYRELSAMINPSPLLARNLFQNFLIETVREGKGVPLCHSSELLKVKQVLETDPASTIDLNRLAKIAELSPRQLTRLFKKSWGKTPIRYFNDYRLDMAAERLIQTCDSVLEIGLSMGYPDGFSFSKAFKLRFEMSPLQYRNKFH